MQMHDAWFFIGIFAFIFIMWVATGGPAHPISFSGPFLSAPSPLGSGTYIGLPAAPFAIGAESDVQLANPDTGSPATLTPNGGSATKGGNTTLSGVSFGPPSSYRGKVSLYHYVSGAGGDPQQEYVTVSLSSSAKTPISISGWSLESAATGNAFSIPEGTEVPTSGTVEPLQPITLNPGDTATILSGRSPIGGSFKENVCIGYFAQFQTFYPRLSNSCPDPQKDLATFYGPNYIHDDACITYVKTLPRCTLSISPPVGIASACGTFLQKHLSYNGCVQSHQNDENFRGTNWRVYLGRSVSTWRSSNEVIKLLDADGNTVDAFSY